MATGTGSVMCWSCHAISAEQWAFRHTDSSIVDDGPARALQFREAIAHRL
jgi:hypothetical protein